MSKAILRLSLILLFTAVSIQAQQIKMMSEGDVEMLPEIKSVVLFEDGKLVIGPSPAADQREKEYQDLDLQSGDEIQFVNGKRVKTMEEFKKNYKTIKTGDEVKFGIKRDTQRFIVAFKKAEGVKGEPRISIKRMDGQNGNVKVENGKIIMNGKKLDIDSLKKAGANIIIKKKEN